MFDGRDRALKGSARFVVFAGTLLAGREQRHRPRVDCNGGRTSLDLNDGRIETSLIKRLQISGKGNGAILGISRDFREQVGGILQPTLPL
jgi:hypothetical protein